MTRILVIFIDGVGIGVDDPEINPFMRARLDMLNELRATATIRPLDAMLGVPGLPQSGTGQTSLFTGLNAALEFGRHFGPWVPTALRDRLARENFLTRAKELGKTVAFANAYPEELFEQQTTERRNRNRSRGPVSDPLRAGPPIAALGAGVLNRHTSQLERGDAVASEITNDGWRKHLKRTGLPVITPAEAGRNLARIAASHDLTLFAHYTTDFVGHRGHMWEAVEALQKVDEFLSGVVAAIPEDALVAVVSDHGNIEDIRVGHTQNAALGFFFGRNHHVFEPVTSLIDVAPTVLSVLADP